jgi:hypothetical protein
MASIARGYSEDGQVGEQVAGHARDDTPAELRKAQDIAIVKLKHGVAPHTRPHSFAEIARVEARIAHRFEDRAASQKALQLDRLEYIADEQMQAWERSKEHAKLVRKKEVADGPQVNGVRAPGRDETTQEVREQHGDPAYHRAAMVAMAELREMLGINAAPKAPVDEQGMTVAPVAPVLFGGYIIHPPPGMTIDPEPEPQWRRNGHGRGG